ncbi:metal ABC transporter ATP-binding protein [Clostridium sp. MD294]|uniref:metal ABC transporter ATP-binding protein n=1 Tax=Clostridium sp. MD294 TaxID=97138 RepID=UPI0002C9DE01|nr:metal ABC transporter ATP-binding protein [Clostridium sp. MD294]NDO47185.1 metal ABC transporter ATP-binding protein [Clostridium sp. MD294]USF29752.1 Zinc import ATP-binding protein ZnuC [Clostridium sp. MD294]
MSVHNNCGLCRVEIENVSVKSGQDVLLDDVNLEFHCGQLTALIGRNGAGKTTLLKAILGERNYTGKIYYEKHNGEEMKNPVIGYVPQQLIFDKSMPVSVADFMMTTTTKRPVWSGYKKQQKQNLFKRLQEMDCADVLNKKLGSLSGGELQRVLLTMAIDPMPDLLILDEPVSGVDATGLDLFYKKVTYLRNTYHIAVLLVSHDLALIRHYADKVVLLDKTVTEQGEAKDVFQTKAFQQTFGYFAGEEKIWN